MTVELDKPFQIMVRLDKRRHWWEGDPEGFVDTAVVTVSWVRVAVWLPPDAEPGSAVAALRAVAERDTLGYAPRMAQPVFIGRRTRPASPDEPWDGPALLQPGWTVEVWGVAVVLDATEASQARSVGI